MSEVHATDQAPPATASGLLRFTPFFAAGRSERRLLGVLQLGATSVALWILSLYFVWDSEQGLLVHDPVNLWFNCILLGAFAMMLFCVLRPNHRIAGAVAICGLTVGMFHGFAEDAFGMFTYNDADPGAGFWLGLASYVVQLLATGYAAALVGDEWCGGCRADGRPRSPWLVLGLGVVGIGWIVARFLPTYVITIRQVPVSESGNPLGESLDPTLQHHDLVARLDGAEFIPEIAGWLILTTAAPLAAWMLRRQLAAAFLSGFLVGPVAGIAAALAVNYSLDYSQDRGNGILTIVDYGLDSGFLAQLVTTALLVFVAAAIYLTGTEHPATDMSVGPEPPDLRRRTL